MTSSPRPSFPTAALRRIGAVALLVPLALTACSPSGPGGDDEPEASPSSASSTRAPKPAPSTTAPTSPSASPTEDASEEATEGTTGATAPAVAPDHRLDAGTTGPGSPAVVQGEGSATVAFTRAGGQVVARLDCSACTGPVVVTGPGRSGGSPYGSGTAPWSGTLMVDFLAVAPSEVFVEAEGPWTLELLTTQDLEVSSGEVTGSGHAVLIVGDVAGSVEVWCGAVPGERCSYAAMGLDGSGSSSLGGFDPGTEGADVLDVSMPGMVAIRTNGEWRVTPQG